MLTPATVAARFGPARQRADECRIVVQGLDPIEFEVELGGPLACFDVDVPEDLEMVGDEADRGHEHLANAARVEVVQLLDDVRAEPGLAGRALALERERPVVETGPLGDELATSRSSSSL